jgi:hypothetical protein
VAEPSNPHYGFLAIWSDVRPDNETDYLHWLTREHAQERLGVPGFVSVRVFHTGIEGFSRYLIFYRLSGPEVVASAEYLARLNAPSEWSRRIMPKLSNFVRGGGAIVHETGAGEGALVMPVLFDAAEIERYRAAADQIAKRNLILAARVFKVDQAASAVPTQEKAMRQGDASFSAMLLLEGLDEQALKAADPLPADKTGSSAVYRQVFALRANRT